MLPCSKFSYYITEGITIFMVILDSVLYVPLSLDATQFFYVLRCLRLNIFHWTSFISSGSFRTLLLKTHFIGNSQNRPVYEFHIPLNSDNKPSRK